MNKEQIKLLNKMKILIRKGKRRFKERKDRSYKDALAKLYLTEEQALKHILSLNSNMYFVNPKPNYYKDNNTLIFKKIINNYKFYIKLKIDLINGEEVVC